jgi:ATP-dependent Clp protease, protease subunit
MKTYEKIQGLLIIIMISIPIMSYAQSGSRPTNSSKPSADVKATDKTDQKSEAVLLQEKLSLENSISEQTLRKELTGLTAEKQRLELTNALKQDRLQSRLSTLQAQIDELGKRFDLLSKQTALKDLEQKSSLDAELALARQRLERIKLTNELLTVESLGKTREITQKQQEMQMHLLEMQMQRADLDNQLAKLNMEIDMREKRDQWKNRVNHDIQYLKDPFKDGKLTISDRRIPLNGVIWMDTADMIIERINYFNNQNSEYPIFIVIDQSPGGSVMAGYKILKAMEGSPAPVYVIVKSFAASMAAGITTMAKKSFCYPNAIILHHQILSWAFGNLTEQKEQVKEMEEWWKRLATPVAAKMNISLDEFIKQMYQHRSTGDWLEFGDSAKKIKWVDEVVDNIIEESYIKKPDSVIAPSQYFYQRDLKEETDSNGRQFILLPRLEPVDCYYLYNPDNYYRLTR